MDVDMGIETQDETVKCHDKYLSIQVHLFPPMQSPWDTWCLCQRCLTSRPELGLPLGTAFASKSLPVASVYLLETTSSYQGWWAKWWCYIFSKRCDHKVIRLLFLCSLFTDCCVFGGLLKKLYNSNTSSQALIAYYVPCGMWYSSRWVMIRTLRPITTYKNYLKVNQLPKCKIWTISFIAKNLKKHRYKSLWPWIWQCSTSNKKVDKLDFVKIKSFCVSQDTIKKGKR